MEPTTSLWLHKFLRSLMAILYLVGNTMLHTQATCPGMSHAPPA